MAEQLLDQVRDIAEGQIVCQPTPATRPYEAMTRIMDIMLTDVSSRRRISRGKSSLSYFLLSYSASLVYVTKKSLGVENSAIAQPTC